LTAAVSIALLHPSTAAVAQDAGGQAPPPANLTDPRAAQPERPTVATHAGTVAPGYIEFEAGIELDHFADASHNTGGTLVTKIGIASHLQLSLYSAVQVPSDNTGGFGDFGVAMKWRLTDDNPILGDFAVLPILTIPTGSVSRGSGNGATAGSLWLISSRDMGPIHLDLNVAYTVRDGSGARMPQSAWFWTTSWGGTFAPKVGWNVECYGYPGTGGASGAAPIVALLIGPTFTANKSLVFDAGVIAPVTGPQPRALYAGATWNAGKIW
jgi:hypothetical protein